MECTMKYQIFIIRVLSKGLPQKLVKKIYLQLLMTQCMVHCVQYLYTILIFNPFITKGVEFLPSFM